MSEIAIRRARAFGVNLFYADCPICKKWVKSGVGQFVWERPGLARTNAIRHAKTHV